MVSDISAQVNTGAELPAEVKGWNWGAFWLCWIWGLGNRTYIALLSLIPGVNVIMAFVLGAKGNRWAWKNRHWESPEQFKEIQKIWSSFGWGMVVGGLLGVLFLAGLLAALVVPVFF